MKLSFYAPFFALTLLITTACQNEEKASTSSETPGLEAIEAPSDQPATPGILPELNMPATTAQQPQAAPATQPVQQPANTRSGNVALNPPHGQPGHRCEIPEGAPLNSAPMTTQPQMTPAAKPAPSGQSQPISIQPTQQPTPTIQTIKPPVNGSGATSGINPPHGEPGHRCDVEVGAPLPKE
jgi:hypothetical protein